MTTFLCTEFLEFCLEVGVGIAVICVHDVLVAVAQTDRETSTIISVKFTDWLLQDVHFIGLDTRENWVGSVLPPLGSGEGGVGGGCLW